MEEGRYIVYEVWDSLTRLLHWLNALSVLLLIAVGSILYLRDNIGLTREWINSLISLHVYIGYPLAAGILIRWIWLFTGPPLSTWKDIIPHKKEQFLTIKETLTFYLKGFKGKPPFYVAHNPLAGIAYMIFFIVAGIQAIVGLILNQIPPLPSGDRQPPEFLIGLHDIGFFVIIIYILLHITTLIIHELSEKRSLISSMIHGSKFFEEKEIKTLKRYVDSIN